jgi:hypothetical protein
MATIIFVLEQDLAVTEPIDPGPDEHFHTDFAVLRTSRVRMESIASFISRASGYAGLLIAFLGLMLFIFR